MALLRYGSILILALLISLARSPQTPPGPAVSGGAQAQTRTEPPAPKATEAVQKLLDEADAAAQAKKPTDALSAAEHALLAAQMAKDAVGEAQANRTQAQAFTTLNRVDEAVVAWKQAASAWKMAGDGPGRVEALVQASVLLATNKQEEAKSLREEALALAQAETERPLAAASGLHSGGSAYYDHVRSQEAQDLFQAALTIREKLAPNSLDVAASLNGLGSVATDQRDLSAAQGYFQRALAIEEKLAPNSLQVATSLVGLGNMAYLRGDLKAALPYYQRALAIREKLVPNSLDMAQSLSGLGIVALSSGDLKTAQECFQRTLAIDENLAPNSLDMAISLGNMGNVALSSGDLKTAQDYYERALTIEEKQAPGSLNVAQNLTSLGNVALYRGDLKAAQDYYERALEICEKQAPDSLDVVYSLSGLGGVAFSRGDLSAAQDYFQRALTIEEKQAPNSLDVAMSLIGLGNVAFSRGDLSAAQGYYERALAIREKKAPNSLAVAQSFTGLASVASDRGDLKAAQDYYERALTIEEKQAHNSLDVAASLTGLGNVASNRGDMKAAQEYQKRALDIQEKLVPNSLDVAMSLNNLGIMAYNHGDLKAAQEYQKRALDIQEKLAPNSFDVAWSLTGLGEIARRQRRFSDARSLLRRSITLIESQRAQIPTPEQRALLVEQNTDAYADLIKTDIDLRDLSDAFQTLERSRARSLVEIIAERGYNLAADLPTDLRTKQEQLDNRRSIALIERDQLDPNERKDNTKLQANSQTLDRLSSLQRDLDAQIQRRSPRYAALVYPQPLTLPQAQQALDPGTLLLTYFVDEKQTSLFAVTRNDIRYYPLSISRKTLQQETQDFRQLCSQDGIPYQHLAVQLYQTLLKPAQKQVDATQRLLICPDGPLHTLPFAALMNGNKHLVEIKPLHFIVSMGVYAQLRAPASSSKSPPSGQVLALGDPLYPSLKSASIETQETQRQIGLMGGKGGALPPLPFSGKLAQRIGQIYGSQARVRLGPAATRATVLREGPQARILHLGCHGLLDDADPLASALALTPTNGQDDGMLRGYDVLKMRLHADLVVLSACQTGLGEVTRSEGIVGLTRAFEYAGARRVLVTQWEVLDRSTAGLLGEFYGRLKGGSSADAALRSAQLSLLKSPDVSLRHPAHWAAFTLVGPWR